MPEREQTWERPESLRERARWYRAFEEAHNDASWALWLAAHLERRADHLEALQARAARYPKDGKPELN
jgi:hypothetical protein